MRCCSCPHGSYAILPILILLAAFASSFIAVNSCRFLRLDVVGYDDYLELGLFGYMDSMDAVYCTLYSTDDVDRFDIMFTLARYAGGIAAGLGGLIMMSSWLLPCHAFRPCSLQLIAATLLVCVILQAVTFFTMSSNVCAGINGGYFEGSKEYECNLTQGAYTSIAACVAWFLGAVIVYLVPKSVTRPPSKKQQEEFQDAVAEHHEMGYPQAAGGKVGGRSGRSNQSGMIISPSRTESRSEEPTSPPGVEGSYRNNRHSRANGRYANNNGVAEEEEFPDVLGTTKSELSYEPSELSYGQSMMSNSFVGDPSVISGLDDDTLPENGKSNSPGRRHVTPSVEP